MRLAIAALVAAAGFLAGVAQAQQTPAPDQCATAYTLAKSERGRLNLKSNDPKWAEYESLLSYLPNASQVDFDDRYRQMKAKFPDDILVQSAFASTGNTDEAMRMSGFFAISDALLNGKSFEAQAAVFARVRQCDQIHGFKPVLDAADLNAVMRSFGARVEAERAARDKRLAALDDAACAARFMIVAVSSANNPPVAQEMQNRTMTLLPKVAAAMPNAPRERVVAEVQRRAQEVGAKAGSEKSLAALAEELNHCERKYGYPVTEMKPAQ